MQTNFQLLLILNVKSNYYLDTLQLSPVYSPQKTYKCILSINLTSHDPNL